MQIIMETKKALPTLLCTDAFQGTDAFIINRNTTAVNASHCCFTVLLLPGCGPRYHFYVVKYAHGRTHTALEETNFSCYVMVCQMTLRSSGWPCMVDIRCLKENLNQPKVHLQALHTEHDAWYRNRPGEYMQLNTVVNFL